MSSRQKFRGFSRAPKSAQSARGNSHELQHKNTKYPGEVSMGALGLSREPANFSVGSRDIPEQPKRGLVTAKSRGFSRALAGSHETPRVLITTRVGCRGISLCRKLRLNAHGRFRENSHPLPSFVSDIIVVSATSADRYQLELIIMKRTWWNLLRSSRFSSSSGVGGNISIHIVEGAGNDFLVLHQDWYNVCYKNSNINRLHSSCEIEYFVETHLCKLCVILRSRVFLCVCPN